MASHWHSSCNLGGIRGTMVTRWTTDQRLERSILHQGHHTLQNSSPRLSPAQYCLTSAESWPKSPIISLCNLTPVFWLKYISCFLTLMILYLLSLTGICDLQNNTLCNQQPHGIKLGQWMPDSVRGREWFTLTIDLYWSMSFRWAVVLYACPPFLIAAPQGLRWENCGNIYN